MDRLFVKLLRASNVTIIREHLKLLVFELLNVYYLEIAIKSQENTTRLIMMCAKHVAKLCKICV